MTAPSDLDTDTILAAETAALRRWGAGDPDGFLEICDPDVTYFDPFTAARLDGLAALSEYYDGVRGQIRIERFELINPRVVVGGELAVLSFNFTAQGGNDVFDWNCTEVYRQAGSRWMIVQTHWSLVRPASAGGRASSAPGEPTPAPTAVIPAAAPFSRR